MSLMAIILWAFLACPPWRRGYERTRRLLQRLLACLDNPRWTRWLDAHPDDREGVAYFERCIVDLNAAIDLLVYIRAREILGLAPARWRCIRPSAPQRRRSQSLDELRARVEACALRFTDMERTAQRRALKLKPLLIPSEFAAPAHAAFIAAVLDGARRASGVLAIPDSCLPALPGPLARLRAGLRARAPP